MSTLRDVSLECPICGTRFRSRAVGPVVGLAPGCRTRTDFRECGNGVEPLPYLVHQCTGCGFAGRDEDFPADADEWAGASPDDVMPADSDRDVPGSEKYEAAARVAGWRGETPRCVAELLLCAAWCCAAEDDTEAERYFRREAARAYERALVGYDDVPCDERAQLTYLVGELWRRSGDDCRAREWFDRVSDEAADRLNQRWLIWLAAQQRSDPQEWLN